MIINRALISAVILVSFAGGGKDGDVIDVKLISGQPAFAQPAIDAVKQWKYKPYLLNGEPVEMETQVLVNFTLAGR